MTEPVMKEVATGKHSAIYSVHNREKGMRNLLSSVIICALPLLSTSAQIPRAGAGFLLIPPSPTMNGLGGIGVSLPSEDTYAAYYNPANGIEPFEGLSLSRSSMDAPWLPNVVADMTYSYDVSNVGLPLDLLNLGTVVRPTVLVLSRHNTFLNLGEQVRIDSDGNPSGTSTYWLSADAYTAGLGLKMRLGKVPLSISVGGTRKKAVQKFGEHKSTNVFYDYGFMVSSRLVYLKSPLLEEVIHMAITPSLGYSVSNIGGEITYIGLTQADPSPRYLRFGLSLSFTVSYKSDFVLARWRGGRAVSDILVEPTSRDDDPIRYQSGFGDANVLYHIIKSNPDSMVTVHRGDEWTFLDIYTLRLGREVNEGGQIDLTTVGYGWNSRGILNLLYVFFDEPIFRKISKYVNVQHNASKWWPEDPDHPFARMKFESLTVTINNIDELLTSLIR